MSETDLLNTQTLGFLRYRKNGRLDEINSAVPKLFGYKSKKEFLSSKTPKEIFIIISEKVAHIDKTAVWSSFKSVFIKKDKSKLHAEYFLSVNDDSYEVILINDIRIQEGLERALSGSEEKSKLTLDTLVDGVITMGTNSLIESVNPAVEKIFGYKAKELIGKNVKILMPEPDKSLHNKYVDSYQKSGKAKIIGIGREVKGRKKNGKIFPIYLGVSELNLPDRKLYIGMIRDISVQKKAEDGFLLARAELENKVTERTSELSDEISFRKATEKILDKQASFVRQNPGPVFQTDYNGTINFANPVSEKLYGKNLINKSIITLMKGVTKSKLKKMKGGKAVLYEEIIGNNTFLLTIIKDTKAKNIYIYGADITLLRQSEELLEKQASFVRQNPGPVFRTDYNGTITFTNPVSERLFGKRLVNKSIITLMKGITKSQLKKLKGERAVLFEEDIGDKTFLLTIIKDTKAKNIYIYGADITLLRQSEELLRVSEDKFRNFFYNQPEYCYVVSPEGIILDVNRAALKILGYKREELVGKSVLKIYPIESHQSAINNMKVWLSTGILKEVEMEIITKHGERRIVHLSCSAVNGKDGKLLHSISVQSDITDRILDQKEKERLSRNLGYRVKELSCLQAVGEIIENETSLSRLLSKVSK
ncbi:MAG: PAS domain S-box protein, partial [Candidatus Marinimicrobia bacterium]|nr:PAS domain S-box protein [Candidatus Neomarinimicrobiota bacterium]